MLLVQLLSVYMVYATVPEAVADIPLSTARACTDEPTGALDVDTTIASDGMAFSIGTEALGIGAAVLTDEAVFEPVCAWAKIVIAIKRPTPRPVAMTPADMPEIFLCGDFICFVCYRIHSLCMTTTRHEHYI
jgi:hypothetical protein